MNNTYVWMKMEHTNQRFCKFMKDRKILAQPLIVDKLLQYLINRFSSWQLWTWKMRLFNKALHQAKSTQHLQCLTMTSLTSRSISWIHKQPSWKESSRFRATSCWRRNLYLYSRQTLSCKTFTPSGMEQKPIRSKYLNHQNVYQKTLRVQACL